jgi:prophage DNA circulation protein
MSYRDRLREFKHIAPSGLEFILQFDSVSRTGGKKAPVSEFPGQNQGAVQDLGNITPTFPQSCYITGVDYDLEADRFYDACHESGPAKIEHPRYGNLTVLPILETQTEEFVDGAGRAVFQLTYIRAEETQFTYPTSTIDYPTQVSASIDNVSTEIGEAVPEEITDTKTLSGLKDNVLSGLDTVTGAFDQVTQITEDVRQQITQQVRDITNNIDELVTSPADLMDEILELYRLPAKEAINIQEKLDSYKNIYTAIADRAIANTLQYGELFGIISASNMAALSSANAEAGVYGTVTTRTQASEVITTIDDFSKTIREKIEDIEAAGNFVLDYQLSLTLENAIAEALNGLIDSALNLPTERTEVLDREVTPIQFVYEKYGDIDQLDFFMEYNNLCCDDIVLMPRGFVARYYFE